MDSDVSSYKPNRILLCTYYMLSSAPAYLHHQFWAIISIRSDTNSVMTEKRCSRKIISPSRPGLEVQSGRLVQIRTYAAIRTRGEDDPPRHPRTSRHPVQLVTHYRLMAGVTAKDYGTPAAVVSVNVCWRCSLSRRRERRLSMPVSWRHLTAARRRKPDNSLATMLRQRK
jgi:hypothetical protein